MQKLEEEGYFARTKFVSNVSVLDKVVSFPSEINNVHYENVTFISVAFKNLNLRYVLFDKCRLDNCTFFNITSQRTYFTDSLISHSVLDHTDFYTSRFIRTAILNSTIVNMRGCPVDFAVSVVYWMMFIEHLLAQVALLPGFFLTAFIVDSVGRVKLLG